MPSVRSDTPLPTPTGWKRAGELRPGDLLFSATGEPVKVIVANQEHVKSAYEVKMVLDPIVVSEDHDLVVKDRSEVGVQVARLGGVSD